MDIKGFVKLVAKNSRNNTIEERNIHNLIFDPDRVYMFFALFNNPFLASISANIYLSSYTGAFDSSSYTNVNADIYHSIPVSGTITEQSKWLQYLVNFPTTVFTQSGGGGSFTLGCLGLDSTVVDYSIGGDPNHNAIFTGVNIGTPLVYDKYTTLFVNYSLQITLDPNDLLFGYESIMRTDPMLFGKYSYANSTGYPPEIPPFQVGLSGYKKYFYVAPICFKTAEFGDYQGINISTENQQNLLFSNTDPRTNYTVNHKFNVNIDQNFQWWCGPYSGIYEFRNSGLGVACVTGIGVSRVFAHNNSNVIFYDSGIQDIPQSNGTLTIDTESITTMEYPVVYTLTFTQGNVGVATFYLNQYIMPNGNNVDCPGGFFSMQFFSSSSIINEVYFKNIYVSGNREWRAYSLGGYIYNGYTDIYPQTYVYVGYKTFERPFLSASDLNKYTIRNDGLLYFTRGTAATTKVYKADMTQEVPLPTILEEFDLSLSCPGFGITNILGLTIDEDAGYLWVATNVGFVRVGILNPDSSYVSGASGGDSGYSLYGYNASGSFSSGHDEFGHSYGYAETGYSFDFIDYNVNGFGNYMTGVNDCVLSDPWCGKFQAMMGTLTWVPENNPQSVWHWDGTNPATNCDIHAQAIISEWATYYNSLSLNASNSYIVNMFVDLDLGFIGVVLSNSLTPSTSVKNLPVVIRIGSPIDTPVASDLILTYISTPANGGGVLGNSVSYPGYSCSMELGKFWFISATGVASPSGFKRYINLLDFTEAHENWSPSFKDAEGGNTNLSGGGSTNEVTSHYLSSNNGWHSPNRSIVQGVTTLNLVCSIYGASCNLLGVDTGPIIYSWTGSSWEIANSTPTPCPTSGSLVNLPGGVIQDNIVAGPSISFNDGPNPPSFRNGEWYNFGVNPNGLYIDNCQSVGIYGSMYGFFCKIRTVTITAGSSYTIPEASSDGYFVEAVFWQYDSHLKVIDSLGNVFTPVNTSPGEGQVQFTSTGTIYFNDADNGKTITITYAYLTRQVE